MALSAPTPQVETTKPLHTHFVRSLLHEAIGVRQAFVNWLPLLGAIAVGRVRRRRPALLMRVRHGPTVQTPAGDRSWWTAVESFGQDCYRLGTAGLPPDPTVVDIGANIGAFALSLLTVRPRAHVDAYEPSPTALGILRANIAANDAHARIAVYHSAVTGKSEPATVWLNEHIGDLCMSTVFELVGSDDMPTHRVEVPAIPLSAILSSYSGFVDLLKMDVEGAEYAIIEATPPELLAKVRRIVIEYHNVPRCQVGDLARHLQEAGFVWVRQEHSTLPGLGVAWWMLPPAGWP